jgi:ATP-dependent 26S proteasome regulatory subunit
MCIAASQCRLAYALSTRASQVDSLAGKRNDDMHESTRRLLGVLLRFIDGFTATDSIIVAATNRKQDLDAAMLSRCDAIVKFDLPNPECRAAILKLYAAQLSEQVRSSPACLPHHAHGCPRFDQYW